MKPLNIRILLLCYLAEYNFVYFGQNHEVEVWGGRGVTYYAIVNFLVKNDRILGQD